MRCTPASAPFGSPSARGYPRRGGVVRVRCALTRQVCRYTGRVTAAKPPKEKRGGFGANKFARNPAALFLPAQSAISRPYFRFELRARADSPRFAAVCATACAHFAALPLVRSTFGLRGFPPISPRCGSSTAHPAGRGGALPRFGGAAKVPCSKPRRGKCREKVPRSPAGGGAV